MNDETKRLLELAAKAAGYTGRVEYSGATGECLFACDMDTAMRTGRTVFLPHDDDGDALRLAVACDMVVSIDKADNRVRVILRQGLHPVWEEELCQDPLSATRRAIFRAAAAVGEAMP